MIDAVHRAVIACLLGGTVMTFALAAQSVPLLNRGDFSAWDEQRFHGATGYETVIVAGERVVKASSNASASGLFLKRPLNLERWPELSWRWRVAGTLHNSIERTRDGDDFVARVYVIAADSLFRWRARAICYVWASSEPVGSLWTNPYDESVKMIVLQSGAPDLLWRTERRNVREDFLRAFGSAPASISAVAIMTDTDNTAQHATAWYDDLRWLASTHR